MVLPRSPRISVVLDPRFPGGTAAAVAAELEQLVKIAKVSVIGLKTAMFKGETVNPKLNAALAGLGLDLEWDPAVISADIIVFHNPSCLKFDEALNSKLVCQSLICVTHENFLAPDGAECFDAGHCLELLDDANLSASRWLAPVSKLNRQTVKDWMSTRRLDWKVAPKDWFNICAFEMHPPVAAPRDRRGRHSRPGFEKFPDRNVMHTLFPSDAEHNAILGADSLMDSDPPYHWTLYRFMEIPPSRLLDEIDFFVYFTNPMWRESFGRVIAEAIAAGKVVITDHATASNFGSGVVGAEPDEVDRIISGFIERPETYAATVMTAQDRLNAYSPERFGLMVSDIIDATLTERAEPI